MNYFLSKERLEELKKEYEHLTTHRRIEVAERLKRAKELGDLSENAEYMEAREEQAQVETRIVELGDIIKGAVLIKKQGGSEISGVGSTVEVAKNGTTVRFSIVGSNETRPEQGFISNESPLGQALLGKKVGDSVIINTPSGKAQYEVIKLE